MQPPPSPPPPPPPPPPSLHSNFFSSLRQVEKRLKLEHPPPPPSESETQEGKFSSMGSLSSPLILHLDCPIANSSDPSLNSEPPSAFLSISQDFPLTHQDPPPSTPSNRHGFETEAEDDEIDDIERLIRLLGLPNKDDNVDLDDDDDDDCNSCHCEGGFHSRIVGVKGPKCKKEMKRLDGWIKHFREEKKEPFRLAHLLLGKAAFISDGVDGGFGGLEFPSTVQEFLHCDPVGY